MHQPSHGCVVAYLGIDALTDLPSICWVTEMSRSVGPIGEQMLQDNGTHLAPRRAHTSRLMGWHQVEIVMTRTLDQVGPAAAA